MSKPARIGEPIALVVFDFDGVLTDNRVLVFEDGREAVQCNRSDGLGFDMLRSNGVPVLILSTERNPVVAHRARKLRTELIQGLHDKRTALLEHCRAKGVDIAQVIFVGNDLNDLAVMAAVGWPVAVADAHPAVKAAARIVLATEGGAGVAREVAETLLALAYDPVKLDAERAATR